jgi:IgA peptidase M64/peptidase M64-like protein
MLRLTLAIVLAVSISTANGTPRTLRVDYFHTGNVDTELFSLDQVVLEPLAFPGNLQQPIDLLLRGKYLFEAIEPGSGKVLWSRSFSSIYGEWETTGEARQQNRTFHESVRLPNQDSIFELVIRKRNAQNDFEEVWRINIDPTDYLVHQESAAYAGQVIAIENNGDPAVKVDLLMLGDGYTASERETFIAKAKELTEVLFATEPFKERRNDFNVWAIVPATAESGISRPSTHTYRDTPVGATYDAFRSERYILSTENKSMRRIASSAPYEFIEILTNTDIYGGGGIHGLYATAAANSAWAEYLFVHEFGHHFAGLADEYFTSSVSYELPEIVTEPYEPNVTALLDPDKLKWRELVEPGTPLPTPWPKVAYEEHSLAYQEIRTRMREENVPEAEMNALFSSNQEFVENMFAESPTRDLIGAFEGANYQAKGYYRSEQNCLMFTRASRFCQVCANAIEQVIDQYTRKGN